MRHLVTAVTAFIAVLLPVGGSAQTIRTFAGGGPNNIPATSAGLDTPVGVATDILGNVYFTVRGQNRVFKVDTSRVMTVVAGNGFQGFSGDGGPAISAELSVPSGVAVDSAGNVFIADTLNQRIREVAASTGIITTVAGNGSPCVTSTTLCGDGGPAISAELAAPEGVVVNSFGNLFIADTNNNRIREVSVLTGIITALAGNGTAGFSGDGGPATSAELNEPTGVAVDSAGNLFIADYSNSSIRRVTVSTGVIATVAGNGTPGFSGDGGMATSAQFRFPSSVAVDSAGNLFIADAGNGRIREVVASTGIINTVAGNGTFGFSGDGGPATSAEFKGPMGVAVDSADNFFIGDTNNNRIRKVTASTSIITTFAGNGSTSPSSAVGTFGGDGFGAAGAQLSVPVGVAVDSSGNIFISDQNNERIREVAASTGIITTVAGNGALGFSGDGGPATSAQLGGPFGLGVDFADYVFIADSGNQRIRKVAASTGIITTVAGNGSPCVTSTTPCGDGGPATSAMFSVPEGVAIDASGNVFIADTFDKRIREVAASTGIITTVAGNGTFGFSGDGGSAASAELSEPTGVAVDLAGNILIADPENQRIRKVTASTGIITTVAGNGTAGFSGDGGLATSAELNRPTGVAVDSAGNLFIVDARNNRIRQVTASTGIITTVAGNGTAGFSGDGGLATSAELNGPTGVAVDSAGNLFIADTNNSRIREVSPGAPGPAVTLAPSPVSFGNQTVGITSAAQTVILTNSGTAALSVTGIAINGTNAADFAQTNTCGALPTTVEPSQSCNIGVTFTPSMTTAENASLVFTDDAPGSPQTVALTGTGGDFSLSPNPTSATVAAGTTASYTLTVAPVNGFNQSVSLTCAGAPAQATCAVTPNSVTPDGTNPIAATVTVATTARSMLPSTSPQWPRVTFRFREEPVLISLLVLVLLAAFVGGKRQRVRLAFAMTVVAILLVTACGGGGGGGGGNTGTPPGTYTLTITAASGSLSHNTTVKLTVN